MLRAGVLWRPRGARQARLHARGSQGDPGDRGAVRLIIRPGTAKDAEAARALVLEAYGHYVDRMEGDRPRPMDDDYSAKLRDLESWVIDGEGRLDALLLIEARDDHLWLENVAVSPHRQGEGIGRELLELAERRAAEAGLAELRLHTHETMVENQAIYRHFGWEPFEVRDDPFPRVWFRKRLELPGG